MYAMVTRRKMNQARWQETRERAESEFFPKVQQAPGFVSLSLIQGEDGVNTAVVVFENKEHADAFREEASGWQRVLDEFGHQLEAQGGGEVVQHITPGS